MGEIRHVKGCCPLDCQDTCAWVAEMEDERVVAVRGAKDHPFTRGVLCAKVNDDEARAYAPDRLLYPLRRIGAKGEGRFERISWDAALDLIAGRFREIIVRHCAEARLPHNYLGTMGVVQRRALLRMFHALGASRMHGHICSVAATALAPGIDLDALKREGWVKTEKTLPRLDTGKLHLAGAIPAPEEPRDGMLRLLTPKAHFFLNSSFANMPRQRHGEVRPTLHMAPSDAAARGLVDGAPVALRNERAAIPATLHVTDEMLPGVVALPGKWWSTAGEEGAVANLLSPSSWSPWGQPAYNDIFVAVSAL